MLYREACEAHDFSHPDGDHHSVAVMNLRHDPRESDLSGHNMEGRATAEAMRPRGVVSFAADERLFPVEGQHQVIFQGDALSRGDSGGHARRCRPRVMHEWVLVDVGGSDLV
jgi:hypothetical protein